jgi:hypothetical protein
MEEERAPPVPGCFIATGHGLLAGIHRVVFTRRIVLTYPLPPLLFRRGRAILGVLPLPSRIIRSV